MGSAFENEDREFHRLLFQHVGNKALLTLLDAFWLVFRKAALHTRIQDPNPMNTYRDHAAILAAIEAGDVAAARRALGAALRWAAEPSAARAEEKERDEHRACAERFLLNDLAAVRADVEDVRHIVQYPFN